MARKERPSRAGPDLWWGWLGCGASRVAGLLCVDPDRARRLVALRLGALAARDETCGRLRETLRTFLACGRNKTLTAEKLHVHHKTVAYRVTQAEAILGRSVAHDAVDVEVALIIDAALHGR